MGLYNCYNLIETLEFIKMVNLSNEKSLKIKILSRLVH